MQLRLFFMHERYTYCLFAEWKGLPVISTPRIYFTDFTNKHYLFRESTLKLPTVRLHFSIRTPSTYSPKHARIERIARRRKLRRGTFSGLFANGRREKS